MTQFSDEMTKGEAIIILSQETVEKVINDLMSVLFELSKPFESPKAVETKPAGGGIGK